MQVSQPLVEEDRTKRARQMKRIGCWHACALSPGAFLFVWCITPRSSGLANSTTACLNLAHRISSSAGGALVARGAADAGAAETDAGGPTSACGAGCCVWLA
eukprot:scaffold250750_cov30-Tisochrysis_lutea.AAC.3